MSKVTIQGDASGTGIFTIASPNSNTDRTLTLPDEAGTIDTLQRAGNVLQVVSVSKTNEFTTTSGTFVDITDLSISITPQSASNKILLLCTMGSFANDNTDGDKRAHMRFTRDGSAICVGDAGTGDEVTLTVNLRSDSGLVHQVPASASFLDSPNTTSSVTYKVQASRGADAFGTVRLNRTSLVDANTGNAATTFTVMEIAG